MLQETPPLKCPKCGSDVVEKRGISKKTNKFYHFWGCSNFKCDYIWKKPSKSEKILGELKEIRLQGECIIERLLKISKSLEEIQNILKKNVDKANYGQ